MLLFKESNTVSSSFRATSVASATDLLFFIPFHWNNLYIIYHIMNLYLFRLIKPTMTIPTKNFRPIIFLKLNRRDLITLCIYLKIAKSLVGEMYFYGEISHHNYVQFSSQSLSIMERTNVIDFQQLPNCALT